MKYTSLLSGMALIVMLGSCKSTKEPTPSNAGNESTMMNEKNKLMIEQGYQEAVLRVNTDKQEAEGCAYIIALDGQLLDPINLVADYRRFLPKDSMNIWIKHQNLRMANRCNMARPINIIDIEKR
ncbi:hypothetical protein GCM10009117_17400 [Gangjinia marincola]|uniref:Uncharacterized protein n=1 Tax=Gangjinia marincola TaxID=578463 RepID=A0ABN1MHW0_9FLAO